MYFYTISNLIWDQLDSSGDIAEGYNGKYLTTPENDKSNLLIFKDENNDLHFVIADDNVKKNQITDPNVNGLKIQLKRYRFNDITIVRQFIDLQCSQIVYVNEFTEIIKEVAQKILVENQDSINALNEVISSWKSFWGKQVKGILSEEEQIGLICELKVLKKLCKINSSYAVDSWRGPLNEKYDFVFSKWIFEIKGTTSKEHIHTIHGINQLESPEDKSLALISFLLSAATNNSARSLQDWITDIVQNSLNRKPEVIEKFYKLLASAGYAPIHKEEYKKTKFNILDGHFFVVDNEFPKLTTADLKRPLNTRIAEISYKINLKGLTGEKVSNLPWGKYFY